MMSHLISAVAVIPTHLASVDSQEKYSLKFISPMIEHVRRRALLCSSQSVVVATCDD